MKRYGIIGYVGLLFLSLMASNLMAEEALVHDAWQVRISSKDAKKVFYMTSLPESQTGNFKKRGQTFISITSRPDQKSFNVFSLTAGYDYKEESSVKVSVFTGDKKKLKGFELFSQNNMAWAVDDKMDQELVQAMRQGEILVVEGISQKGTISTDTYSLKGFTAAYKELESVSKKS
ncbi:MAG TPA: invasion associated locus B family protein [Alphaproteobacteria bacterium]|nr:invasion associated locus B family protein [Alphaproteobacteria bacterium]HQS93278.1 invasion associated locus B family protein [Alphaproteobacteria bacterium]